jgi:hypothetical protein
MGVGTFARGTLALSPIAQIHVSMVDQSPEIDFMQMYFISRNLGKFNCESATAISAANGIMEWQFGCMPIAIFDALIPLKLT